MKGWLGIAALLAVACNPARAFVTPAAEYADYRRVRVADTADERLATAWEYLERHPDGVYAERLRRYLRQVEPVFYKMRRRTTAGLESYLAALPDGPHAEEALARLVMLSDRKRREAADLRAFEQTQARLKWWRVRRDKAARLPLEWVSLLMAPEVWRRPLAEAPKELVVRYELGLPQPLCEPVDGGGRRCIKPVEQRYDLVASGRRIEASVAFMVELRLDPTGKPLRALITGPALFTRAEEARREKAIDELDDRALKAAQRSFVARLTEHLFERELLCEGTTEPDATSVFVCEGIRLNIDPGAGGHDRILIEPE